MSDVPPIEKVRGAVAYLKQPLLERLKDAGDDFGRMGELTDQATDILVRHALPAVALHEETAAGQERVSRGMMFGLCGVCKEEIPQLSSYGYDWDRFFNLCERCYNAPSLPDSPDE